MLSKRGQSWSVDIIVAVVIFGLITAMITSFAFLSKPDTEFLSRESQELSLVLEKPIVVPQVPDFNCDPLIQGDSLNDEGINCLYNKTGDNITYFAQAYNIDAKFCLYIEDENGKIVSFLNKNGWGYPDLEVGGVPCGQ